jgi:hypothetical protein
MASTTRRRVVALVMNTGVTAPGAVTTRLQNAADAIACPADSSIYDFFPAWTRWRPRSATAASATTPSTGTDRCGSKPVNRMMTRRATRSPVSGRNRRHGRPRTPSPPRWPSRRPTTNSPSSDPAVTTSSSSNSPSTCSWTGLTDSSNKTGFQSIRPDEPPQRQPEGTEGASCWAVCSTSRCRPAGPRGPASAWFCSVRRCSRAGLRSSRRCSARECGSRREFRRPTPWSTGPASPVLDWRDLQHARLRNLPCPCLRSTPTADRHSHVSRSERQNPAAGIKRHELGADRACGTAQRLAGQRARERVRTGPRLCQRPLARLRRSRLRREPRIGDLETALYTRHVIGVPRGILMERNRMTLDFPSTSRRASQNTNVRLASVTGLEETAVIVDSTKPPAPSRAGGPGVSCGPGNGTTVTAESDGTLGYWPERPTAGRCRWPGRQLGLSCRAPPLLNWCGRR